jgi:hypothetical protein
LPSESEIKEIKNGIKDGIEDVDEFLTASSENVLIFCLKQMNSLVLDHVECIYIWVEFVGSSSTLTKAYTRHVVP